MSSTWSTCTWGLRSLLHVPEAVGAGWDKTCAHMVPRSSRGLVCLPTGMFFFITFASLCARPGSKSSPHGSLAGWRQLPALCLAARAGCLLQAGTQPPAWGFSPRAGSASVSPAVRWARGSPFPTLAGKWLCASLQSLGGQSLALAGSRMSPSIPQPAWAHARTSKQPSGTAPRGGAGLLHQSLVFTLSHWHPGPDWEAASQSWSSPGVGGCWE